MGTFKRHDHPDQAFLFPPSPRDWLPDDHLAWFISDTVPAELARRETRLKKIREAKKRLEERKAQEAREKDEATARKAKTEGRKPPKERPRGRKHPKGKPKPKDQENFTDPDSRIMTMGGGHFEQCYNAQIAVDDKDRIIVGAWVSQCPADSHHLLRTIDEVEKNTGEAPNKVLADAGYRSEDNLRQLRERGIDGFVSLGREGKTPRRSNLPETCRMKRKLQTKRGRTAYNKRCRTSVWLDQVDPGLSSVLPARAGKGARGVGPGMCRHEPTAHGDALGMAVTPPHAETPRAAVA